MKDISVFRFLEQRKRHRSIGKAAKKDGLERVFPVQKQGSMYKSNREIICVFMQKELVL